ncbi:MAG: hypothetical protein H6811_07355 [Phycisphaeraceae bacterium]|nr:hypothetical protein [Phycisphaeraceae bacterium]
MSTRRFVAGVALAFVGANALAQENIVEPVIHEAPAPAMRGGSTGLVYPEFVTWEDVERARIARAGRHTPRAPDPNPISPWLARGVMYENPQEIAAIRQRIADFEAEARAAIAAGREPPKYWDPYDPKTQQWDPSDPFAPPSGIPSFQGMTGAGFGRTIVPPTQGDGKPDGPGASPGRTLGLPNGDPAGGTGVSAPTQYLGWQGEDDTWRPSDSTCAVGPAHVGMVINCEIAFYTKDGTQDYFANAEDFFSTAPAGSDLFDPKIAFDPHNGHWLMVFLNGRRLAQTYYALAISVNSDPNAGWWVYYLRSDVDGSTDTALWADFPGLGFDSGSAVNGTGGGAVYITTNQYTAGDSFQYAKLRVLPKHQLYAGAGVSWWDFWNMTNPNDSSKVFAIKPAMTYSGVTSGGNPVEYLLNTKSGGAAFITRWRLTDPLASGPTLASANINTNTYTAPPNARQSGGGTTLLIDTGDCRTQDVQYRFSNVYMGCGDSDDWGDPTNVEATIRLFNISALAATINYQAEFGANDAWYSFPAIKVDADSDATVIFSYSNLTQFPGSRITGRLSTDTAFQGSAQVRAGDATYNPTTDSVERWGDYNGLGVDCAGDMRGVWTIAQFADTGTQWGTWIQGSSFGEQNVLHLQDQGTSGFLSSDTLGDYTWELTSFDWSGVAIYNQIGGNNNVACYDECPYGTAYQNSTFGVDIRDFVVANGTTNGNEFHHARVTWVSGPTGYRIEARNNSIDASVGTSIVGNFVGTELLDLYEVSFTSGKTYAVTVDPVSATADLNIYLFRGSRLNGRRADNDGAAQSTTGGLTETLVFTAGESSLHGIAVMNENFANTDYTFKTWLKPVINAIGNATIPAGVPYTGPTPSLSEGTTPVTWSLVTGPAGMTINATTGVVSWPVPVPPAHAVTIRATNPAGFDDESWTLTVNPPACDGNPACPADIFPGPFGDGVLDGNDFFKFLDWFATGDRCADLAAPFGTLDGNDFFRYLDLFAAGC